MSFFEGYFNNYIQCVQGFLACCDTLLFIQLLKAVAQRLYHLEETCDVDCSKY